MYGGIAWICVFVNNSALNGQAIYGGDAVFCNFENNTCNNTGFYPEIKVSDLTTKYGSGENLSFNLTYNGMIFEDLKITIKLYKDDKLIDTYYCLSGKDWPVNLNSGTYKVVLSYDEYPSVKPVNATLLINKLETVIESSPVTTVYDTKDYLIAVLKDFYGKAMAGFDLTVNFNGVKTYTTDKNGMIKVPTSGLAAGNYTAKITFDGNENYKKSDVRVNVTINKTPSDITINDISDFVFGDTVNVIFDVINRASVMAIVSGNDKIIVVDEVSGNIIDLGRLDIGKYTILIMNRGNQKISSSQSSANFTVRSKDVSLSIFVNDMVYGQDIKGVVSASVDGEYAVTIGNYKTKVTVTNNVGVFNIGILNAGTYEAIVEYIGERKRNSISNSSTFKVRPEETTLDLDANATDVFYGDSVKVFVKDITESVRGKIKYYLDNGTLLGEVDVNETLILPRLNAGTYAIIGNYNGDENHNSVVNTLSITIKKVDTGITASPTVDESKVTIDVNVNPMAKRYVSINVSGQSFIVEVKDGKAVFKNEFNPGTYRAEVTYLGDVNFNNASTTTSFTIIHDEPGLENATIDIMVLTKDNDVTITAIVDSDASGLVEFNIDGSASYVPVNNGKSVLKTTLPAGNYKVVATYLGDGKFNANKTSEEFSVKDHIKRNTTINAEAAVDGYDVTITVNVDKDTTGNIIIGISGQNFIVPIKNGKAILTYKFFPGIYAADVIYPGDENFNKASTTTSFTITEEKHELKNTTINVDVTTQDNEVTITAYVNPAATGLVEFNIDGSTSYIPVNNGNAVLRTTLDAGDYNAVITYLGDSGFNANKTSKAFSVKDPVKKNTTIDLDVNDDFIVVKVEADATGLVKLEIGGKKYYAPVENGIATINIQSLDAGKHTVAVNYAGDDNYEPASKNMTIPAKDKIEIIAPNVVKYYHGSERFNAYVVFNGNPLADKVLSIILNGVTYTKTTDKDGMATIALNLDSGNYDVSVQVDDMVVKSLVTIKPTVKGTDVVKMHRNATQYYATFLDSDGKFLADGTTVQFNINGVLYDRKIQGNEGLARMNINLDAGKYIITAINPITGESAANNITVLSKIVENRNMTKYYKNATQYTIQILGDDGQAVGAGKSVIFNINGLFYERQTNASGIAKLNINLDAGDYIITAEYEGCAVSNNIKVLPLVTAKDLTKKYDTPDQFTVTLVDGQGKPYTDQTVQFNVNGVMYNRVTDTQGQAKLNINLIPDEYIITSMYNGTAIANKITILS